MNGQQLRQLKLLNEETFRRFLEGFKGGCLKPDISSCSRETFPCNLTAQTHEGEFPDAQLRTLLCFLDLPQRHCAWAMPILSSCTGSCLDGDHFCSPLAVDRLDPALPLLLNPSLGNLETTSDSFGDCAAFWLLPVSRRIARWVFLSCCGVGFELFLALLLKLLLSVPFLSFAGFSLQLVSLQPCSLLSLPCLLFQSLPGCSGGFNPLFILPRQPRLSGARGGPFI